MFGPAPGWQFDDEDEPLGIGATAPAASGRERAGPRPVDNAPDIARALYPGIEITDWQRDPNSDLGRDNPDSWHVRTRSAIDSRPLPGMTFDQYVQGYRDRGFQILEARDEVTNPSSHATGPHWHIALAGDGSGYSPASDGGLPQGWTFDDEPQDEQEPGPAPGWTFETEAPTLPNWQAGNVSDRVQAFLEPPRGPQLPGELGRNTRPGEAPQQLPEDARVAPITRRDDPRLAGLNQRVASMFANPNVTGPEIAAEIGRFGLDVNRIGSSGPGQWAQLMAWRNSPEGRNWMANPNRPAQSVNLDDLILPPDQQRNAVVSETPQPDITRGATISSHEPDLSERLGGMWANVAGADQGNRMERFLSDVTPVGAYDLANESERRRLLAMGEGRHFDALGNTAMRDFAALGILPFPAFRGAGRAAQSGEDALRAAMRREWGLGRTEALRGSASPFSLAIGGAGARVGETLPGFNPAGITPEGIMPRGANTVDSLEEARRANPGTIRDYQAPSPESLLEVRSYSHPRTGNSVRFRGPLDVESFLRTQGGIRDQGGELRHIGIDNRSRAEAPGEHRLGPILNNRDGMTLDEAGERLWEARYFSERPTTADVLDVLRSGRIGHRMWNPRDLGDVADYEAAQANRWQAQAAAQEGRPLADDIGQPVSYDDLDAMEPPATAYEDLPAVRGRIGSLNLERMESPEQLAGAFQTIEQQLRAANPAYRRRVSNVETQALAQDMGVSFDDLMKRRRGQPFTASEAVAYRSLMEWSYSRMIGLARNARRSDEDLLAFHRAVEANAAVHARVSESINEMGRAFQSLKITSAPGMVGRQAMREWQNTIGGRERIEAIADRIIELEQAGVGPGGTARFAAMAVRPKASDMALQLFYNSILSGPRTHAANFISNTLTAATQPAEYAVAAGIGAARNAARRALGRERTTDAVLASEIGPRFYGLVQGGRDAIRAFGRTARTGDVTDPFTKLELAHHNPIGGRVGHWINTPTRLLAASDEGFKALARRVDLNGLAMRQARNEGLRGAAARNRATELVANPPEAMLQQAVDYARYSTFTRPLGEWGENVVKLLDSNRLSRLVVPFVRTITNLGKYSIARSPIAPILGEVRREIAAGGAARDLALARIAVGSSIGGMAAYLASQGIITGSRPPNRSTANLMEADGWQANSIRVGGRYYSYERIQPFAVTLGIAADLASLSDFMSGGERDRVAALVSASIGRRLLDETYASGANSFLDVIEAPAGTGGQVFAARLASLPIPVGVQQVAQAMDPFEREARTILERVQSRVPGLRQRLPERRDRLGQALRNEDGPLNIINPLRSRQRHNDPVIREMIQVHAPLGRPSRTVAGVRLDTPTYNLYDSMAGALTYQAWSDLAADPGWRSLPVSERRREASRARERALRDARRELGLDWEDERRSDDRPLLPPGWDWDEDEGAGTVGPRY